MEKQSVLEKLSGNTTKDQPGTLRLDDGRVFRVTPWSLRKFAVMGKAISKIMRAGLALANKLRVDEFREAQRKAEDEGLASPKIEDFENFTMDDIVALMPSIIEEATQEFAFVISESLTSREQSVSIDEVMDQFSWTGDIPRSVASIIEVNFTGDESMGEWKRLLGMAKKRLIRQAS